mmetsp:Transcript_37752/g.119988  ORF Transcript_37752/g.119988 Transcript_37752/m.119988 type:complete len:327 (+) Transcript_37752:418-1398(+)
MRLHLLPQRRRHPLRLLLHAHLRHHRHLEPLRRRRTLRHRRRALFRPTVGEVLGFGQFRDPSGLGRIQALRGLGKERGAKQLHLLPMLDLHLRDCVHMRLTGLLFRLLHLRQHTPRLGSLGLERLQRRPLRHQRPLLRLHHRRLRPLPPPPLPATLLLGRNFGRATLLCRRPRRRRRRRMSLRRRLRRRHSLRGLSRALLCGGGLGGGGGGGGLSRELAGRGREKAGSFLLLGDRERRLVFDAFLFELLGARLAPLYFGLHGGACRGQLLIFLQSNRLRDLSPGFRIARCSLRRPNHRRVRLFTFTLHLSQARRLLSTHRLGALAT